MSNNSWADAHIVKPFIKTNEVVGLHAERDAHLVDWEGIERRMNARWEEIKMRIRIKFGEVKHEQD